MKSERAMNLTVISGGQTGVDQAALRAAKAAGIPTGGWAPKGWTTEDGPAPWLADYGLDECGSDDYPTRTRLNVELADATLLLVGGIVGYGSRGSQLVKRLAGDVRKPLIVADLDRQPSAVTIAADIRTLGIRTLNVAGNRESGNPGIGAKAEAFLAEVFRLLKD